MSWLLWSSHLFHKCNWWHVIDTILQLYMVAVLGIKLKSISVRSWRWTSLCLPQSSYCSKGAPQNGKSELCPYVNYDRCIWLPVLCSYFFSQSFVDSGTIPPLVIKDKGIEWRLFNLNHSLVILILFSCCW